MEQKETVPESVANAQDEKAITERIQENIAENTADTQIDSQDTTQNSSDELKHGENSHEKKKREKVERVFTMNGKQITRKQKIRYTALKWILINVATLMMAASVFFFQAANNFTLGGMGGLSIVLSNLITPHVPWLSQAVILAIINVVLLIVGFIVLGKKPMLPTIYCSLVYTAEIFVLEFVFNYIEIKTGNSILPFTGGEQKLLELCYAILLMGVGAAIIFNFGASSGGSDIIALILKKYTSINVGKALMIVDTIIVCISFYTFRNDPSIALFSVLGLFAKSFILDGVIENIGKTKYITIITKQPELIAEFILNAIHHSYTMYDAEGGYTKEKRKVIITVCKRGEALKLKTKVKQVDPDAFVIVTDANEILGKGFGPNF